MYIDIYMYLCMDWVCTYIHAERQYALAEVFKSDWLRGCVRT